ncbi:hypothetical protein [Klebsiella phage Kp2]|uniref:Uncharacterized protein n=1 Tax=Klebsiella phage Kp2 TaxID=1701805 RepID=A0A0P0HS18_9CAUD|nr:hypothetical protein AU150_gp21 [Klebsiella phage Kp2]ALJ98118.1 hypothetical protein [Klebsiella phage Kp2]
MSIKPGSIVELLELGPEPIDPKLALYYAPGTQHRVIGYDPITWEVELLHPDNGSEDPGDGVTFFPGEYKLIVE